MIIGVDLGNYAVKTSEKCYFLSKISEEEKFSNENEVIYDYKKIFVGEGEFRTDWNKANKDTTLPLLFTALARSSKDTYFQVVLGLPVQQFKQNKESLKLYIEENKTKKLILNGIQRDIVITDIEIAPEGASVYYNLSDDEKYSIGKKPLLIVDIGGRTTDITLFKQEGSKKIIADYKTVSTGMLNIYSDVVDKINEVFTINYSLEEGEEIIKNGLFLYGKDQDLSFIRPLIKKHFDRILKEMNLKFNVDQGYVLLTGGGSNALQIPFKKRIPNLIISKDAIFDNATSFKKVGEVLWQER